MGLGQFAESAVSARAKVRPASSRTRVDALRCERPVHLADDRLLLSPSIASSCSCQRAGGMPLSPGATPLSSWPLKIAGPTEAQASKTKGAPASGPVQSDALSGNCRHQTSAQTPSRRPIDSRLLLSAARPPKSKTPLWTAMAAATATATELTPKARVHKSRQTIELAALAWRPNFARSLSATKKWPARRPKQVERPIFQPPQTVHDY